jgi:hypothetical protein
VGLGSIPASGKTKERTGQRKKHMIEFSRSMYPGAMIRLTLALLAGVLSALASAQETQDEYAPYARHEEETYRAKSCLHNARGEERCAESRLTVTRFPDAKWLDTLLAQKATAFAQDSFEAWRERGGRAIPAFVEVEQILRPEVQYLHAPDFQRFVEEHATLHESYKEGDEYIYGDEFQGDLKFGGRYGDLLQFSHHVWTHGGGAAHGFGGVDNFLLNIKTHAPVTLEDILVAPEKRAVLDTLQRDAYRDLLVENEFFSDRGEELDAFLAEWFSPNDNWKIVQGGLAFNYADYEAGPYAMGAPEVRVPKAALQGIIKPDIVKLIP